MLPFVRMLEYGNIAPLPAAVKKVQCSTRSAFVLKDDGKLYARGVNNQGAIGTGNTGEASVDWTLVDDSVDDVWCSESTTIYRRLDGTLWYSGSQRFMYSNGSVYTWTAMPTVWMSSAIAAGLQTTNIVDVQFTFYDALVLFSNGKVYGSGFNSSSAVTGSNSRAYLQLCTSNNVSTFKSIACGQTFSTALGTDGFWYRCGSNASGQLSTGNTSTTYSTYTMYNTLGQIGDISAAYESSMIYSTTNNGLFGSGSQVGNQIGLGATSGNQLSFRNALSSSSYGGFNFFVQQNSGAYSNRKFMSFGNGIYSTSPSGFVQVSNLVVTDKRMICSGGNANVMFTVGGALYAAGNPLIFTGTAGSDYYDARSITMPS